MRAKLGKYLLPAAAVALLVFAGVHAYQAQRPAPDVPPPVPPPSSPFGQTVAGAGMVEPSSEASTTAAISVASQVAGVVTDVPVRVGQEVKAGELLFQLDRRAAEADLKARQAALAVAQAQLRQMELQPRPETVPPQEALLKAAEANLRQAKDQYERDKQMPADAVSALDRYAHEQAYLAAVAQRDQARATLDLLKAGAWQADKDVAYAQVEQARAQVQQAQTALDLLQVRAPLDGTVLQVNVRPGEYVAAAAGQGLVVMGNTHPLQVRVNIDEEDLPRLKLNAPARAKVRGDVAQAELPLRFVRLELFVVPKASLTGANTERVDTRVVQVIYALDPGERLVREQKVLVGQLVDVFIDTRPAPRETE
jgi:multidrug efflux pump subunit AcrA (membrane-fusion protein)